LFAPRLNRLLVGLNSETFLPLGKAALHAPVIPLNLHSTAAEAAFLEETGYDGPEQREGEAWLRPSGAVASLNFSLKSAHDGSFHPTAAHHARDH
jgi:hypothetical protein